MTRRHPDARRLDDLAYRMTRDAKLVQQLANRTHDAHNHIAQELSVLGWPRRSGDPGVSGSGTGEKVKYIDEETGEEQTDTVHLTSVERDADTSYRFTAIREDMRDQITRLLDEYSATCAHIKATGLVIHAAATTGLTREERNRLGSAPQPTCSDNQHGKHAADEWGDALCHMPGVKAGLCLLHYQAWYRARQRDGIDTSRDHGAVA